MDFALRYVRFYPGVNRRAELVTLAPGLRPERRFASWLGDNIVSLPQAAPIITVKGSMVFYSWYVAFNFAGSNFEILFTNILEVNEIILKQYCQQKSLYLSAGCLLSKINGCQLCLVF